MKSFSFKLPDLGEGMIEAEIVEWKIKPGDRVEVEQVIVDIMTDKATVEMTSPVSGTVTSITGEPGDTINVGEELVKFDTEDESVPTESATAVTAPAMADTKAADSMPDTAPAIPAQLARTSLAQTPLAQTPLAQTPLTQTRLTQTQSTTVSRGKVLTSPAIRRRAREHNVDLAQIPATGPKGRITREDLDGYLAAGTIPSSARREPRHDTLEIKVIGLRRKIAEKMTMSARHIPHFTYVEEVDMAQLESLRRHLNDKYHDERPRLTYLPFLIQALVRALEEFPQCNAHFDDERNVITRYAAVHAGIATQTDNGLMVPVVKHVESLDLWQVAAEIGRVARAAQSGKITRNELAGSTITVTSLGALGGIVSTPVINYPEVAIIGVNKVQMRPVVHGGAVTPRPMMNLSSSFDHRVVDGYDAARMIQSLKTLLEQPATIFI